MKRKEFDGLMKNMRAIGPASVLAAALAVSPAFAQSTTTTTESSGGLSHKETKTQVHEHGDGSVSAEQTTKKKIGPVTVGKEKSTVHEAAPPPASTTTTTTRSTTY